VVGEDVREDVEQDQDECEKQEDPDRGQKKLAESVHVRILQSGRGLVLQG
jgi:hypothetical protein